MTFSDLPNYNEYIKATPTITLIEFLEKGNEDKELRKHMVVLEKNDLAIVTIALTPEILVGENFDILVSDPDISNYKICNVKLIHASLRMSKAPEMILYSGHPYLCVFRFENEIPEQILSIPKYFNILTKREYFMPLLV